MEPEEPPGTPDLSIFGAKIPLPEQDETKPPPERESGPEPTQQMPQLDAYDARERTERSYDPDAPPRRAKGRAGRRRRSVVDEWLAKQSEQMAEESPQPGAEEAPSTGDLPEQRPQPAAWDDLAPEIRSDRPARPLYRFEDPGVKNEPRSHIEGQLPPGEEVRPFEEQPRFDDLAGRGDQSAEWSDEPELRTPARSRPDGPPRPRRRILAPREPAYRREEQQPGDWAADEPAAQNGASGHAEFNGHGEDEPREPRVLQWQKGGEEVVAAERRASILKNTQANARVQPADEAMIVEDGLVYVLVDDEGQPVLS